MYRCGALEGVWTGAEWYLYLPPRSCYNENHKLQVNPFELRSNTIKKGVFTIRFASQKKCEIFNIGWVKILRGWDVLVPVTCPLKKQ